MSIVRHGADHFAELTARYGLHAFGHVFHAQQEDAQPAEDAGDQFVY